MFAGADTPKKFIFAGSAPASAEGVRPSGSPFRLTSVGVFCAGFFVYHRDNLALITYI